MGGWVGGWLGGWLGGWVVEKVEEIKAVRMRYCKLGGLGGWVRGIRRGWVGGWVGEWLTYRTWMVFSRSTSPWP